MILKQFYLNCLAHASYLIGDEQSRTAAVVDPQRDIDQYLSFAGEHGLDITHVFLTHFHADFIAGHLELRDRTGATIYLGAAASAEYAFTPLRDGDVIEFGRVRLQALETPGHTAESISIVVYDLDRSGTEPQAVLTGDTLFVGDVGRPDLRVALGWSAADLGGLLYDSLRSKLLTLPDRSLVYPAHGAGSLCGKALSKETVSTIGEQRRFNYALQPMSKAAFVELVTADQPDAPAYFTYDAVLNSKERPTLDETLERDQPADARSRAGAAGLRSARRFSTRAIRRSSPPRTSPAASTSASAGSTPRGPARCSARDRPIVIIADPGREHEAATRLGRIGFDHIVGYLEDGLHSLASRPELTMSTERVSAQVAADRVHAQTDDGAPVLIDVRAPREREQKRIPGSLSIPLNHLAERTSELPADRPLLVYCAGGYRSSIAASLLQRQGFTHVSEIAGGITAWEAAKLPIET